MAKKAPRGLENEGMRTSGNFDIAIIGGGLAGASTAYHLAKNSSASILLLEKEKEFGTHASGRNAGMLRQAVGLPAIAAAVQETLRALLDPPDDWKNKNCFRMTGSLLLGSRASVGRLERVLAEAGGESSRFDAGEFPAELAPGWRRRLEQSGHEALLHSPRDGVVDVPALLENFLHAAQERGIRALAGTQVESLRTADAGWILECGSAAYGARVVVDASGAWAGRLAPRGFGSLPELQPMRRHLMVSEPVGDVGAEEPWIWHVDEEFYFRPEAGGLLLSPGDEDPLPPDGKLANDAAPAWLAEKLAPHFPEFGRLALARVWACLRTKSRDGSFLIEWDPNLPDYFWAAALGGHGVSASVGAGRRAAREILKKFP